MNLAVYADLHANYPALSAMQDQAGQVDQWLALGDSVGLYPQVNEVLDWQRLNQVLCVSGDHEQALLKTQSIPGSYTATDSLTRQATVLSAENFLFLSELSSSIEIKSDGVRLLGTHFIGDVSRESTGKYLLDISAMEDLYNDYNYVFFGHTHLPTVIYGRNTVFINPGSAGFPIDVERRPSFVILNTISRSFRFLRFDYDTNVLVQCIESAGYNRKLIEYIRNGHRWI